MTRCWEVIDAQMALQSDGFVDIDYPTLNSVSIPAVDIDYPTPNFVSIYAKG